MNKIIALVGMCGSGKSVACDYFVSKGYKRIYFGQVTMDILKEKNLEVNAENEKVIRENLRKEYGMGAFATLLLPKIKEYAENYDVILDGLYSWEELKILQKEFENIKVIAIIADKKIRYERLVNRDVRPLTIEEAKKRDISEIENLEKGGPIAYADYFALNNNGLDEFYQNIDSIIERIDNE